jgi:hypothetical protein
MEESVLWDSVWIGHRAERCMSKYCGRSCGMCIGQSDGGVNTVGKLWTGHRAERCMSECGTACGLGIRQSEGRVGTVGQRVDWS